MAKTLQKLLHIAIQPSKLHYFLAHVDQEEGLII